MLPSEHKTCMTCRIEKPVNAFEVRLDRRGSLRGECRTCRGRAQAVREAADRRAVRPASLPCEGGCGMSIEQNPNGTKLRRWCGFCRSQRYYDRYNPPRKCLDCPNEGRFGQGQQRCEECRAKRQAENEARRLVREVKASTQPSYTTLHLQLRDARGRAADQDCTECGGPATEWSYDHTDPDEITEARPGRTPVRYSLDHDRYQPMCRSCHTSFDARESVNRKPCAVPDCETRIFLRFDFCHSHRPLAARDTAGGRGLDPTITDLVLARAGQETDSCLDCGETKPVGELSRCRRAKKGYLRVCRPCMSARNLARYHRKRAQLV